MRYATPTFQIADLLKVSRLQWGIELEMSDDDEQGGSEDVAVANNDLASGVEYKYEAPSTTEVRVSLALFPLVDFGEKNCDAGLRVCRSLGQGRGQGSDRWI